MNARILPKIVQMKINKLKWSTCKNAYWLCKIYKSVYKQKAKVQMRLQPETIDLQQLEIYTDVQMWLQQETRNVFKIEIYRN